MYMCRGMIPLKLVVQICLLFEVMISLLYATIFVILSSYVWWILMTLYILEMGFSVILMTGVFSRVNKCAVGGRFLFAILSQGTLLLFWVFQDTLLDAKKKGEHLSIHYFVVRLLFDVFTFYWIWSYYV